MARVLQAQGADFWFIPANTAQLLSAGDCAQRRSRRWTWWTLSIQKLAAPARD